jgi:hypothetical protein
LESSCGVEAEWWREGEDSEKKRQAFCAFLHTLTTHGATVSEKSRCRAVRAPVADLAVADVAQRIFFLVFRAS